MPDARLPCLVTQPAPSIADQLAELPLKYPHIIAVTAWCRRFISRIKKELPEPDVNPRHLTGLERRKAEEWLLIAKHRNVSFTRKFLS